MAPHGGSDLIEMTTHLPEPQLTPITLGLGLQHIHGGQGGRQYSVPSTEAGRREKPAEGPGTEPVASGAAAGEARDPPRSCADSKTGGQGTIAPPCSRQPWIPGLERTLRPGEQGCRLRGVTLQRAQNCPLHTQVTLGCWGCGRASQPCCPGPEAKRVETPGRASACPVSARHSRTRLGAFTSLTSL